MQVNGLNSSEYYWKLQLQKNQTLDVAEIASGSGSVSNTFQAMMDSYINSENTQTNGETPEVSSNYTDMRPMAASFNMMPLVMMQMNALPDSTAQPDQDHILPSFGQTSEDMLNSLTEEQEPVSA